MLCLLDKLAVVFLCVAHPGHWVATHLPTRRDGRLCVDF